MPALRKKQPPAERARRLGRISRKIYFLHCSDPQAPLSAAPIQYLDVLVREFDREPAYPGYVGFRPVECLP